MSQAAATLEPEIARRAWSHFALPWLLSSTTHALALLGLALLITHSGAAQRSGPTLGLGLGNKSAVTVSMGMSSLGDGEGSDGGADGKPSSRYFEDDATPQSAGQRAFSGESAATGQPSSGATVGAGAALAAIFNEKPPVDLTGVLPTASKSIGMTVEENTGVGTVHDYTKGKRGGPPLPSGYAQTGVFGVQGQGHKFVYVFDRSASMDGHAGAPLAAAKSQLLASLRDLGPTHQFQVIFYNEHPRAFSLSGSPGKLVFGNDHNKLLARRFIEGIIADGGTQHEDALMVALRLNPDVIFFLTDADEPGMSPAQLQRVERINQGTSINTVEFGYGPPSGRENFLVQLARKNDGKYVYIDVTQLARPK